MTEILVNAAIFLLAIFSVTYTPWAKRLSGKHAPATHRAVFAALVIDLYLFSLNETIRESGVLYGVSFSMIPLAVGAIVFSRMRESGREVNPQG